MTIYRYLADSVLPAINLARLDSTCRSPVDAANTVDLLGTIESETSQAMAGHLWLAILESWKVPAKQLAVASAVARHLSSCCGISVSAAETYSRQWLDELAKAAAKHKSTFAVSQSISKRPEPLFRSDDQLIDSLQDETAVNRYLAYSRFAVDAALTRRHLAALETALANETDAFLIFLGTKAKNAATQNT